MALNQNLDGANLVKLKESDLALAPYNIDNKQIRGLLIDSVKVLKNYSFQSIDFWDYKVKFMQSLAPLTRLDKNCCFYLDSISKI